MSRLTFPQPELNAPKVGETYWVAFNSNSEPGKHSWLGDSLDKQWLDRGLVYLTESDAKARIDYDLAQARKLIIPKWFRDLGPDVELRSVSGSWVKFDVESGLAPFLDWSLQRPENYRAKPKPKPGVVSVVNGVEYRWPATVEETDRAFGARHQVTASGVKFHGHSTLSGDRVHYTSDGAEAQYAALNAAIGGAK